jgi:hypothetical protein
LVKKEGYIEKSPGKAKIINNFRLSSGMGAWPSGWRGICIWKKLR